MITVARFAFDVYLISDRLSEEAFTLLIAMLPTGPKKGIKRKRRNPSDGVEELFMRFEVSIIQFASQGLKTFYEKLN